MKKFITLLTIVALVGMVFSGCKKDDEKTDAGVTRDITNKDWHGFMDTYKKNGSSWTSLDERSFVVLRFNGAPNALVGSGYQLEFKNANMAGDPSDRSPFNWAIANGAIHIAYTTPGWSDVWIDYNNSVVSTTTFSGDMYDHNEHKYTFLFQQGISIDWKKYFN